AWCAAGPGGSHVGQCRLGRRAVSRRVQRAAEGHSDRIEDRPITQAGSLPGRLRVAAPAIAPLPWPARMSFAGWQRGALAGAVVAGTVASRATGRYLPDASAPREHEVTDDERAVEAASVCIGSRVSSLGELSPVLYYRRAWLPDGRVAVG